METPRYELEDRIAEIAAAAAVVLVVGLLLWSPGNVYWVAVADAVGDGVTMGIVAGLAVGLGGWFGRTTAIAISHLVVGGLLVYLAGMAAIEVTLTPDSPVHLIWYGILFGCFLGGTVIVRAIEWFRTPG